MTRPKVFLFAAISLALFCTHVNGATISLIDAGTGNGDFLQDPTGVAAGAAVAVNGAAALSTNGNGRALSGIGTIDGGSFADIATITDNRGVEFDDWGVYRWFYQSGNNAMGLLENGGRLGKANAANDGQVFANSSDYFVLSDPVAYAGSAGDVLDFSVLAGTDISGGIFGLDIYLVFDGGPAGVLVQSNSSQTTTGSTFAGSYTAPAAFSTVQYGFAVDAVQANDNNGVSTRTLLDDARLHVCPVPEPTGLAFLGLLSGVILVFRRRR